MDRIEDQVLFVIGTGVAGDLVTGATNDDLMNIAPHPDLPVAVGDGNGIVVGLITFYIAKQNRIWRIGPYSLKLFGDAKILNQVASAVNGKSSQP